MCVTGHPLESETSILMLVYRVVNLAGISVKLR